MKFCYNNNASTWAPSVDHIISILYTHWKLLFPWLFLLYIFLCILSIFPWEKPGYQRFAITFHKWKVHVEWNSPHAVYPPVYSAMPSFKGIVGTQGSLKTNQFLMRNVGLRSHCRHTNFIKESSWSLLAFLPR